VSIRSPCLPSAPGEVCNRSIHGHNKVHVIYESSSCLSKTAKIIWIDVYIGVVSVIAALPFRETASAGNKNHMADQINVQTSPKGWLRSIIFIYF
jgi:hypothetical protein